MIAGWDTFMISPEGRDSMLKRAEGLMPDRERGYAYPGMRTSRISASLPIPSGLTPAA